MENKFLKNNFEYILDEIYSYRDDPHDIEYFVSVYFDEDENPHILNRWRMVIRLHYSNL